MDACLAARSASHVAAGATTDDASPRIPTAALAVGRTITRFGRDAGTTLRVVNGPARPAWASAARGI